MDRKAARMPQENDGARQRQATASFSVEIEERDDPTVLGPGPRGSGTIEFTDDRRAVLTVLGPKRVWGYVILVWLAIVVIVSLPLHFAYGTPVIMLGVPNFIFLVLLYAIISPFAKPEKTIYEIDTNTSDAYALRNEDVVFLRTSGGDRFDIRPRRGDGLRFLATVQEAFGDRFRFVDHPPDSVETKRPSGPEEPSQEAVLEQIREVISRLCDLPEEELHEGFRIDTYLQDGSEEVEDLQLALEYEFGLDPQVVRNLQAGTLGQLAAAVSQHVGATNRPEPSATQ